MYEYYRVKAYKWEKIILQVKWNWTTHRLIKKCFFPLKLRVQKWNLHQQNHKSIDETWLQEVNLEANTESKSKSTIKTTYCTNQECSNWSKSHKRVHIWWPLHECSKTIYQQIWKVHAERNNSQCLCIWKWACKIIF